VATHFPLLTSLASESNTFANYKISINFHPDGRVEYPYQIEPGISSQHVALHVLRSQGISHRFLDDALERLQH
jgi:DNA mismatch repair ATPase MutS